MRVSDLPSWGCFITTVAGWIIGTCWFDHIMVWKNLWSMVDLQDVHLVVACTPTNFWSCSAFHFFHDSFQIAKCHIKVELVDDSFTLLRGEILGPPDTPYEGGTYILDIRIPETYPFNPPKVGPPWERGIFLDEFSNFAVSDSCRFNFSQKSGILTSAQSLVPFVWTFSKTNGEWFIQVGNFILEFGHLFLTASRWPCTYSWEIVTLRSVCSGLHIGRLQHDCIIRGLTLRRLLHLSTV